MIPKKIKVLGQEVSISRKKLKDCYGTFEIDDKSGKGKIAIDKDIDDEHAESILLHETIHAILHFSGVVEHLSEELEESIVVALQNGLSPLYQQRPTARTK